MGKLVWLASYPKSGNTWVRAFLYNLFCRTEQPAAINDLARVVPTDSDRALYIAVAGEEARNLTAQQQAALRPKVHAHLAESSPHNRVIKTHVCQAEQGGVPLITWEVSAGAIYVLRNPLDTVLSLAAQGAMTIDDAIAVMGRPGNVIRPSAEHVAVHFGSWSENVASWTAKREPRILVLRYEDLLAQPEKMFERVVGFLGFPCTPLEVERATRFSSFEELRRQEQAGGFEERSELADAFFREGRQGEWRERLTAEQVDLICRQHGPQMARFGYLPDEYRQRAAVQA